MSEAGQHIATLLGRSGSSRLPGRGGAVVADPEIYERASSDPEAFWAEQAERARMVAPLDR